MRYLKYGYLLLFLFLFAFPFLILPRLLKVREINCFTQFDRCGEEWEVKFQPLIGQSYQEVKRQTKEILAPDFGVKDYSFQLLLPGKVEINLLVQKPKYALKKEGEEKVVLVGSGGLVLKEEKETNLPKVVIKSDLPQVGETADSFLVLALGIMDKIFFSYQVKEGFLVTDYLEIPFPDGFKVLFPITAANDVVFGGLRIILSRLNEAGLASKMGSVKEVDMRFKNPIIR